MHLRRTVRRAFERSGVGVHSGVAVRATVSPAAWGAGITVRGVPATIDHVTGAGGATVLGGVSTVEHLLAALWAHGVTDAVIDVDGPEIPILDGSAAPWVAALRAAGLADGPPVDPLVISEVIEVTAHGGVARAAPFDGCVLAVDVDFDDPALPRGHLELPLERFDEAAGARTFVLVRDVERLRAAGRGRGASPANTVVVPGDAAAPDEPIRHKWLDLVGDLALLGRPLAGRVVVVRGSHALHHDLVRAVARSN